MMSTIKRSALAFALLLAMTTCLSLPAAAATVQSSDYFKNATVSVSAAGKGKIQIKIYTLGTVTMQRLGVTQIQVQEKQANGTFQSIYTYTRTNTPSLMGTNCRTHTASVTYQGTSGKQYRAVAIFYTQNASGSDATVITSNAVTA